MNRKRTGFVSRPLQIFINLFLSARPVLGCLVADAREKRNRFVCRIGKQNRNPVQLVHVIRWVNAIGFSERSEHFKRQFQVDNIDRFVAVKAEFSP